MVTIDKPADTTTGQTRRDRYGRYLVAHPETGRETGYSRVTTVAKTLDDGGGLVAWKAAMATVGAFTRPGLSAAWQALIAETGGDPWYHDDTSKQRAKQLVAECAEAAGSSDRATLGTALHSLTDLADRDQPVPHLSGTLAADLDAYRTTLADARIVIDTEMIEQMVILDAFQVAGTADRLRVALPDGRHVVADLKTGANLDYSWQSIAVQMAAYANADFRYRQLPAGGGERIPMPDLDRTVGVVFHLPAGEARCTIHEIDLVAGWEAFQLAIMVRQWRSRKTVARLFSAPATPPPTAVERSREGVPDPSWCADQASPPEPVATQVVDALRAQIAGMSETDRRTLVERWPPGVSLRDPATLTPEIVTGLEQLVAEIESFGDVESVHIARGTVERPTRWQPATPDEGGDAATVVVDTLRGHVAALTDQQRAWISGIAQQSRHAGLSWHLAERQTSRRVSILYALRRVAADLDCDDGALRGLLAHIHPPNIAYAPDVTVGQLVGALDADHAYKLDGLANNAAVGDMALSFDDDGHHIWSPTG
jgi:hypothetical protein